MSFAAIKFARALVTDLVLWAHKDCIACVDLAQLCNIEGDNATTLRLFYNKLVTVTLAQDGGFVVSEQQHCGKQQG